MTEALKIERSNPVDEMLSDEEVIEYFLDCCREDRESAGFPAGNSVKLERETQEAQQACLLTTHSTPESAPKTS